VTFAAAPPRAVPGEGRAAASAYARSNRQRFVAELKELVRFPTVSAQPQHAADIQRCAVWLARLLQRIGLEGVRVVPTPRHPVVYGEWLRAPGRPTLIVYGHYDVQPAGHLSAWRTPPFEPRRRGDDLYGRGAADDKGQLSAQLRALESYLATSRALPVNVKCILDGEEEIGSPNLRAFLESNRRELAADVAVMSDTRMLGPGRPALTYSLRGSLSLELEVHGPPRNLHAGNFGGAVLNPLQALAEAVASLHRRDGRVAVPGFYDRVRGVSPAERERMARSGPTAAEILGHAGIAQGWGERGYTAYERTTIRPALTVNGLTGGYGGPGGKSIVPAHGSAKLNVRLVPDQDPFELEALISSHFARCLPRAVSWKLRRGGAAPAATIDRTHPAMRAAAAAYRAGFGATPVFVRSGGTIPVVNMFEDLFAAPTVLLGFALPDDGIHGPNEKFHLPNLFRGIETCIAFLAELSTTGLRHPTRGV
jgi:acetylornithine deacetylase/succinyl-diaminopimelate desuccinylase-like protein